MAPITNQQLSTTTSRIMLSEADLATSPFSEASAFITSHVPISSGSALQETLHFGTTLRRAFRIVTNSSDHAFLNSTGDPIALSLLHLDNASTRPADIATYRFRATIIPSKFHAALSDFPEQSFLFSPALPQSQVTPADSDLTSRAPFREPDVATLSSLQAVFDSHQHVYDADGITSDTIFDSVGLPSGTDTFSNYTMPALVSPAETTLFYTTFVSPSILLLVQSAFRYRTLLLMSPLCYVFSSAYAAATAQLPLR
jgi:hypothetical protein